MPGVLQARRRAGAAARTLELRRGRPYPAPATFSGSLDTWRVGRPVAHARRTKRAPSAIAWRARAGFPAQVCWRLRGPRNAYARGVGDCRTTEGSSILLCDEERESAALFASELEELGHEVTIVCSCAEAFSAACAHDYDVLVAAPFLRDGATLLLPRTLGIRRPRLMILMTRMTERLSAAASQRVGFDAQLTRVVDARKLDRILRAAAARQAAVAAVAVVEDAPPASEVGARGPGRLR